MPLVMPLSITVGAELPLTPQMLLRLTSVTGSRQGDTLLHSLRMRVSVLASKMLAAHSTPGSVLMTKL